MGELLLQAESLVYAYGEGEPRALDGLSLTVRRGRKIALMGPNGSGKSTFLLCCAGICRPQSGRLLFDGCEVAYDRKSLLRLRSRVGLVFQDPDNQLILADVSQEISFGPLNLGVPEEEARRRVESVIGRLGIAPFRRRPTHELSGGQKKLVSIAGVLVMQPELVILDEPAAALDPKHAMLVNDVIGQMTADGITVMTATHDADYAYEWADEVILLHEGRALRQGPPAQVFADREALRLTNLQQPAVLRLFGELCAGGVLDPSLPPPENLQALGERIARSVRSGEQA